jgi:acetyl esterase
VGDPLDDDVAVLLAELRQHGVELDKPTDAASVRSEFDDLMSMLHPDQPQPFAGAIEGGTIESDGEHVAIRTYRPEGVREHDGVLVYAHGGGWVSGDLDSCDPHIRRTATLLDAVVVSVDYRKAPEHPYPAPLVDLVTVHRWAALTFRPRWLGLAGDSAGGNLAAAAALVASRNGVQCDGQLLFYPALDPLMAGSSHRDFGSGYLLEHRAMRWYWQSYQGPHIPPEHPLLAPAWSANEALSRVAPAVIATAGFDPLRDEGNEYAQRLANAGVPTVHLEEPSLIHGWLDQLDRVSAARDAHERAVAAFAELVLAVTRPNNGPLYMQPPDDEPRS